MCFLAQLWKDNSGRLENKNGDWMYMEETWIFSEDESEYIGQVIKNTLGRVLKANTLTKSMYLTLQHTIKTHSGNLLA